MHCTSATAHLHVWRQQVYSATQDAEDELTQLYKGNAGLIDAVAELKVQVIAASYWFCLHTLQ